MNEGFVKLWRKSLESRVFKNEGLWKVWTWCLMKASHKKRWVSIKAGKNEIEVEVSQGQFVFGRKSAAKQLKMKPGTVRTRMDKLKNMQNITIVPTTQYSIISIVNWEVYQGSEEKDTSEDTSQTPARHQPDTSLTPQTRMYKNVKNVKEVKKKIKRKKSTKKFIPPLQTEVESYFIEKGFSCELGKKAWEFYDAGDWVDSKGTPVKNWKQKMLGVWMKEENKIKNNNTAKANALGKHAQNFIDVGNAFINGD